MKGGWPGADAYSTLGGPRRVERPGGPVGVGPRDGRVVPGASKMTQTLVDPADSRCGDSTLVPGVGGSPPAAVGMVAVDLDGTLLRTTKGLSRRNAEAIRRVAALGVPVVLATARPPRSVRPIHRALGLTVPTVNYNGAVVDDPTTGRFLLHRPLDAAVATRIVRLARRVHPELLVLVENLDRWYTAQPNHAMLEAVAGKTGPDFVAPFEALLARAMTKLMLLGPRAALDRLQAELPRRFAGGVSLMRSGAQWLQVFDASADKAGGLAWLSERWGVPASGVVAIGDAANDVGMLRWAGWGVAVANASEPTRRAADMVAPSNDADGVAWALERYVLDADGRAAAA